MDDPEDNLSKTISFCTKLTHTKSRILSPSIFLASTPKKSWLLSASESRINNPARPSIPASGFCSECCIPLASTSAVTFLSPAPSTWHGSVGSLLKRPDLNISKLATAKPSLREKTLPDSFDRYDHLFPEPASSRTETTNKSIKRRVRSCASMRLGQDWRSWLMRGLPPTSKCCQRPCGGMLS